MPGDIYYGGRYRTRTCDPLHVKQVLIPAELTVRQKRMLLYLLPGHLSSIFFHAKMDGTASDRAGSPAVEEERT